MAVARSPHLLHPPRRHFPHSNSDLSTFKTSSKDSILRTRISTSASTAAVRGNARWACPCLAGSELLSSSSSSSSRRLPKWVSGVWGQCVKFAVPGALAVALSLSGLGIAEAKVGVNKPQLLPKDFTPLIDVAGFLSPSQERKLILEIIDIEKDTGFKLRVLAQNYPDTPGLAVRDFWQVDDRTIVFVADPTFGNILNFNVGALVDLDIPRSFWSRLSGKYGNMFYWKEKGEDASIEAAVMAISSCLREPVGPRNCIDVK